ncbi:MAG: hypothetical protein KDA21_07200, partial [Phycisphaerales bacterium]|nr:hypothetical protein [Phycisphaerales bacterium]
MTRRLSWPLTLGFGVSVLLHVGGAWGVLVAGSGSQTPRAPLTTRLFEPVPEDDTQDIHLGSLTSDAMTMVWLGYDEATEHSAPESVTEQAAFDPGAPAPTSPLDDVVPEPAT